MNRPIFAKLQVRMNKEKSNYFKVVEVNYHIIHLQQMILGILPQGWVN